MIRSTHIVVVALCAFLIGCDQAALMKGFAPLQDEQIARQYLELLIQGKVDAIEHDMDPSVVDVNVKDKLVKVADMLPAEAPKSTKVVAAMSHKGEGFQSQKLFSNANSRAGGTYLTSHYREKEALRPSSALA